MNTGGARCPLCGRMVPTHDYRLCFHWNAPGCFEYGVPGVCQPFGCEGGGTVDEKGKAASERWKAAQKERRDALAAFASGDHQPLWRLDPWEAHVLEGGD